MRARIVKLLVLKKSFDAAARLELMRLSLDIIELVKKREKTSTIFSTFFDLKNASQKLETAFFMVI